MPTLCIQHGIMYIIQPPWRDWLTKGLPNTATLIIWWWVDRHFYLFLDHPLATTLFISSPQSWPEAPLVWDETEAKSLNGKIQHFGSFSDFPHLASESSSSRLLHPFDSSTIPPTFSMRCSRPTLYFSLHLRSNLFSKSYSKYLKVICWLDGFQYCDINALKEIM